MRQWVSISPQKTSQHWRPARKGGLPVCSANACTKPAAPQVMSLNCTVVRATGMKTTAWSSKPFSTLRPPTIWAVPSASLKHRACPCKFRGAGAPVLNWLESLPATVLDARPSLWVTYATALFFVGRHTAVEQKLQAAEAALPGREQDDRLGDLVGRIA